MIYREINKEGKNYIFKFTGRHIYCYLHAISETTNSLNIINKIIINYTNKELVKELKGQLIDHARLSEIMIVIDKMLNGEEIVVYLETQETNISNKIKWFNTLFLDQNSTNIMPPITIH